MPIYITGSPAGNVSGTTALNATTNTLINRALRMVGAYAASDQPRPEQVNDALDILNMMLKSWQTEGFLWLKEFATLTLVAGQYIYTLGPNSTDTCRYDKDNTLVGRPTRVFLATRKPANGSEVPMQTISRSDYMQLPNKSTQGYPVQYYYDPQTVDGKLYLWPAPSDATDTIKLSIDRPVNLQVSDLDTYDLPDEWMEVICYGLAERLWFEYPTSGADYKMLFGRYTALRDAIIAYNMEYVSAFLQPTRY